MTINKIGDILNKKKWQPKLDSLEGLPIRPSVKETRFYIDNEYFKKGYGAIFPHSVTSVYNVLAMHANHEKQICFPSADTVMRLSGITNKNTVFLAFKILEAYSLVAIVNRRSKGRVPNVYALLDASKWEPVNSINFDTVVRSIREKKTVSNNHNQQLQNPPPNRGTSDTRNHLMDSDKEITEENKETTKKEERQNRLTVATKHLLADYFSEEEVASALSHLPSNGGDALGFKPILEAMRQLGIQPRKPLPSWML